MALLGSVVGKLRRSGGVRLQDHLRPFKSTIDLLTPPPPPSTTIRSSSRSRSIFHHGHYSAETRRRRPDAYSFRGGYDGGIGTMTTVEEPMNARILSLAQHAVNEHNQKNENANLRFVSVVVASLQLDTGLKWTINLEATDGNETNNYQAVLWDKPGGKSVELLEWSSIGDALSNIDIKQSGVGTMTKVEAPENEARILHNAQYAINEHNQKNENAHLRFVRVVEASLQIVAGLKWTIHLEATDGSETSIYKAVLWDKPGGKSIEVLEWLRIG